MILVIVGEEPFHLRGVHAAIRLCDIDRGNAQRWEYVTCHLPERDERANDNPDNQDRNGERATKRKLYQIHRSLDPVLTATGATKSKDAIETQYYYGWPKNPATPEMGVGCATSR